MVNRPFFNRASKALDAAHRACFNHPDRDILGMSSGPFSGVNEALEIVAELEDEINHLRVSLKSVTESRDAATSIITRLRVEREKMENCVDLSGTNQQEPRSSTNVLIRAMSEALSAAKSFIVIEHLSPAIHAFEREKRNEARDIIVRMIDHALTKEVEETTLVALANESATQFSNPPSHGVGELPSEEEIAQILMSTWLRDVGAWAKSNGIQKHEALKAARAVLSAIRPVGEWQDIETAPKDEPDEYGQRETVILGWWSSEPKPTWQWVAAEWNGEEWKAVGEPPYCHFSHCKPSHWQPLPSPPTRTR